MNAPTQKYYNLTLPMGRFVGGDLYSPKTTDSEGRPMVYKNGEKTGQPRVDYYVAYAIPKDPAAPAWYQTDWGKDICAAGFAFFGNTAQRTDFAWKITDGDSTIPNTKQKRPCDNEGYPGHWILHLGRSSAPVIVNQDGKAPILPTAADPTPVKRGFYVQAGISVTSNGSTQNPGIFLNHNAVSLQFAGQVISSGPDVAGMGFGGNAMPAGAQALPAFAHGAPGAQMPGLPQMQPGGHVMVNVQHQQPAIPGLQPVPQPVAALPGFQPQQQMQPQVQQFQPQQAPVQQFQQQPVAAPQQFQAPMQQQAAPNHAFVQQAIGAPAPQQGGIINPALQQAPANTLPAFQPQAAYAPQMGPNATPGVTYQQYKDQGYPDDYMRVNGIIL